MTLAAEYCPSMTLLQKAAVLLLQTAAVLAGPAYAPFTSFGNFTRRTDLCADAARVARGEVLLRLRIML